MSHLSILPTVLRDADTLISALASLGLKARRGGQVSGFAGDQRTVELQIQLATGQTLGWQRQADGRLALVADLQRLSHSQSLQRLLARITRSYAVHAALRLASVDPALAAAEVVLTA
ncbi:MAG: DUF1257 domain-containing protein [Cyanobacteria bacterium K_Offshore_0m_m2_072]|nr:DUF1257 domain-containing protein [Cyanobacteria bacterium K_Offshore_0m_m2_072]